MRRTDADQSAGSTCASQGRRRRPRAASRERLRRRSSGARFPALRTKSRDSSLSPWRPDPAGFQPIRRPAERRHGPEGRPRFLTRPTPLDRHRHLARQAGWCWLSFCLDVGTLLADATPDQLGCTLFNSCGATQATASSTPTPCSYLSSQPVPGRRRDRPSCAHPCRMGQATEARLPSACLRGPR